MKFFIFKLFLISLAVLLILQTALVIIDSKQNGFTTLSIPTSANNFQSNSVQYTFTFTAKENYLGSISLPVNVLRNGGVNFQIREAKSNKLYYQSNYSTDGLKLLSLYPFGFPVIKNSKDQQYQVIIKPVHSTQIALVSINTSHMTTRYSYPKNILIHNKKLLFSLLLKKYLGFVSFITLFLSFLIALFLLNPKIAIRQIKNFAESFLNELGKEKIYKNLTLFIVFTILFYTNLVELNLSEALLWLVGLGLLYLLTIRIGEKLLFVVPFFFVLLLFFSLLTNHYLLTTTYGTLVYVFLFVAIVQFFLNLFISFFSNKTLEYKKNWIVKLFLIVSVFALLIAAFNKTYILGGDDSRLYFIYPQLYFQKYVVINGLDGGVSNIINFLPSTSIAPFAILLLVLKTLTGPINLQMSLFVLNIIGGIIFFYFLLKYLFPGKQFEYFIARILACLFYVFSIFDFYTLLNSLLIAQFLISLFPLSMYLYIKGIKESKYYLLCLCAVIWSVFSFVLISLPWFAGGFIAFIPIIVWFFWKEKRKFISMNIFFIVVLLLLNAYWIISVSSSSLTNNTSTNSVVSAQFRNQNAQGIIDTATINKVFFPLLNLYHYDIQNNFHWPYLPIFTSWYLKFLVLNSVFILFIFWVGTKMQNDSLKKIYSACSLGFFITVYLFTVNIGTAGVRIFLFLSNHVPGFVMFRNMYDKFGYAMALSFSLLLFISLIYFLTSKTKILYKRIITGFFVLIILLNALPFLIGEFYSLPIWTTAHSYTSITALNHDYMNLVSYVSQQPDPSRYLWLPLNSGNISQIQDENMQNHYYTGTSPLLLLSGKNDYSGLLSFGDPGQEIKNDILHRRYIPLGRMYQQYNVRYIIVNNTVTKDLKDSYICAYGDNICTYQDNKYKKFFLGKKIKDFGSRYTLYEINPQFLTNKVYLTRNISVIPNNKNLPYDRNSAATYTLRASHLKGNENLVFLNPYFSDWKLFAQDNMSLPDTNHTKVFNYANSWTLNEARIVSNLPNSDYIKNADGSINMTIRLQFNQNKIDEIFIILAIATYTAIFVYAILVLIKYEIRKN